MSKDDVADPFDERVVASLLRVDTILDLYRMKKRERDEECHVEEPSMAERVMMAQVINQIQMAEVMTGGGAGGLDHIMKRIDDLRGGLFEEIKAHVESIMTGKLPASPFAEMRPPADFATQPPPTPEEIATLNRMFEADGAPDFQTLLDMAPQQAMQALYRLRVSRKTPATAVAADDMAALEAAFNPPPTKMIVQVVPADVHAAFEDLLFKASVPMPEAKRVLELLVSTKEGKDMLALMVHDAVKIQRKRAAPPPA